MEDNPAVILSGASRGLGAAIARRLGSVNASVVLLARSTVALEAVATDVERFGGKAICVAGDVSDAGVCAQVVEKCRNAFGGVDALINNAAVLPPLAPTIDTDVAQWRRHFEVNVFGPYYLIRFAAEYLRQSRGRIVNISSGAANRVIFAAGAYCAAKAALTHLTRVLAVEEPQITSIAVRPGVVDTDMQATLRRVGPQVMPAHEGRFYQELKADGKLEPPDVPGKSIAWLALYAPPAWSGEFLNYDESRITRPANDVFKMEISK